jgi:hypothetical protein
MPVGFSENFLYSNLPRSGLLEPTPLQPANGMKLPAWFLTCRAPAAHAGPLHHDAWAVRNAAAGVKAEAALAAADPTAFLFE